MSINKNTIKDYDSENNSEEVDFIHYSGSFGGISQESKFWDVFEEIGEDNLLKSKIIKIKIFLGKYNEKICINGIAYTYKNLCTGNITTYEHRGSDEYINFKELIIKNDEYLTDFHIRIDSYNADCIYQLGYTTNKNNKILVGSDEGKDMIIESNGGNNINFGIFGCFNIRLDAIGYLYISKKVFWKLKLFPYFYLRYLYQKDLIFQEKWNQKNKELPIICQYLWNVIKLDNNLFGCIIKYVFCYDDRLKNIN